MKCLLERTSMLLLIVLFAGFSTGCIILNGGNGGGGHGSDGGNNGDNGETPTCDSPETLDSYMNDSDTTLDGCYEAPDGLKIGDTTLTLKPGTVVKFGDSADLRVQGKLVAEGTEDNPVVFTGTQETKGWWKGIMLIGSEKSNVLEHVVVEYAGSSSFGGISSGVNLFLQKSNVAIRNTTFRHSGGYGLGVDDSTLSDFKENTLTSNAKGAAVVDFNDLGDLDAASQYSGNDTDRIRVTYGPVTEDSKVASLGVPFQLTDRAGEFNDGANLTIAKGNVFEFDEEGKIKAKSGTLTVEGTSDAKVVFRGTEQNAGWWEGISFWKDSQKNVLEHVVIADAGKNSEGNLQLAFDGEPASATLDNVTFKNGSNAGISAHSEQNSTARGCSNLNVQNCAAEARIGGTDKSLSEFENTICE